MSLAFSALPLSHRIIYFVKVGQLFHMLFSYRTHLMNKIVHTGDMLELKQSQIMAV